MSAGQQSSVIVLHQEKKSKFQKRLKNESSGCETQTVESEVEI